MASIFTYNDVSRVSSPWSTPGRSSSPQVAEKGTLSRQHSTQIPSRIGLPPLSLKDVGITKLEPEPQDGSTEYKLHLLLRPRRKFVSTSTGNLLSGSLHSKASLSSSGTRLDIEAALLRPSFVPSTQTRQARLQQLTTQLLWRLQQSSPFHSSSVANLVLPLLPEATPKLGLPTRPAKVLPGLEESQGALYEIGVADDGTLVGLIQDELEESLTNLKAMAASLGCVVELQRKVVVGECEWTENDHGPAALDLNTEALWVAEALVRPDMTSSDVGNSSSLSSTAPDIKEEALLSETEQLRITITGNSASGKSSLLGVLTTSSLDNGRGRSRLSLLKHRHEIASGITSSVAQELIGYCSSETAGPSRVVNYSSKNVSSWVDIHNLTNRLVFLSDSPGLSRYAKSTFRTLLSWKPHWTIVCVAADADGIVGTASSSPAGARSTPLGSTLHPPGSIGSEEDLASAFTHLDLCLRLDLPLFITITKMDQATKPGLRSILGKLLSMLKGAGKRPVLLSNPSGTDLHDSSDQGPDLQRVLVSDALDIEHLIRSHRDHVQDLVPLIFTSAVTGAGISKLHALLNSLSYFQSPLRGPATLDSPILHYVDLAPLKLFHIDEVFMIPPSKVYSGPEETNPNHGIVVCGFVKASPISIGDDLDLGPFLPEPGHHIADLPRSPSYASKNGQASAGRSLPTDFAKSLQLETPAMPISGAQESSTSGSFMRVRVVSLRNLRLPVRSLLPDQVGTIGVIPLNPSPIQRARKGMVLIGTDFTSGAPSDLTGHRAFTAIFRASDFAAAGSPPLILAGHALIYVNSVRAAVKVVAVSLANNDHVASEPGSPVAEIFAFDSDGSEGDNMTKDNGGREDEDTRREIRIKFRFVSSVEWMQLGDKVLVVPTASAAGPVAGPVVAATGLGGFVGRISELAD